MNALSPIIRSSILSPSMRWKGFSLIELMVSMVIGLLLLVGLSSIYVATSQSARFQGATAKIQNNARYAFELIAMDIRMLGFTGSQDANPMNLIDMSDPDSDVCLLVDIFGTKNCTGGMGPLVGFENTNPPGTNACATSTSSPSCYLANTDSLAVVHVDTMNKYGISSHTAGTSFILSTWPNSDVPTEGEIFVAADYTHAAVFQISGTNPNTRTVSYGTRSSIVPGNLGTDLGKFGGGNNAINLYRLSGAFYYIGKNPIGEPALYRYKLGLATNPTTGEIITSPYTATGTPEELVQGVENMQITYGVDTSADSTARSPLPGDGNVDAYWTAEQVSKGTGIKSAICDANNSAHWKCVLSIRIQLTLVSGQDEKLGTTSDKLLRNTFSNTIAIRNRL